MRMKIWIPNLFSFTFQNYVLGVGEFFMGSPQVSPSYTGFHRVARVSLEETGGAVSDGPFDDSSNPRTRNVAPFIRRSDH